RMASNRSSSGPSTSTTTLSQQNISSSSAKPKFSTRVGELIKIHIPISYKEWRLVPVNFKDDVWNALMVLLLTYISFLVLICYMSVCREIIEVSFPPYYRRFKYELR
ncbi:hypothetical protein MKW92_051983, partial [Papaver armeniacum]